MSQFGQLDEGIQGRVLVRLFGEIVDRMLEFATSERNQIAALSKFDDNAIAICCNAVLAAGCVAYIIKQDNSCKLDTEHLKWHMFLGGRSIMGKPPHLAVSMFMDWRTPHSIKTRCITRTLRARYNPHPCG